MVTPAPPPPKEWFVVMGICNIPVVFHTHLFAFVNKGYDDLEVVIETISENVFSTEISTEILLLGQIEEENSTSSLKSKGKAGN